MADSSGWNRPSSGTKVEAKKSPTAMRGALAGGLVVVVLGFGAWIMFGGKATPSAKHVEKAAPTAIKEVKPAAAAKYVEKKEPEAPKRKKAETYVDERGVERYKIGNARVPKPVDPDKVIPCGTPQVGPRFKHYCEQELAALITIEPGEVRHGMVEYDAAFMKDFQEALVDKIEYEEGDSEDDKRLKDQVAELKKELAERIRKGEDLKTILETERDEMTRLANYKSSLENLFEEARQKEGFTVQDAKDFYAAANEMLKKEGIKPMEISGLTLRRLQRQMEREQQATGNGNE